MFQMLHIHTMYASLPSLCWFCLCVAVQIFCHCNANKAMELVSERKYTISMIEYLVFVTNLTENVAYLHRLPEVLYDLLT